MSYRDPVHILHEEITVKYPDGKYAYMLNKRLLDQRNCWNNIKDLVRLHELKLYIHGLIKEETNSFTLRKYTEDLTLIEFELQKLWGFSEDKKFHRFWDTPKCDCPKLDNEDNYPYGHYLINFSCPLHGLL